VSGIVRGLRVQYISFLSGLEKPTAPSMPHCMHRLLRKFESKLSSRRRDTSQSSFRDDMESDDTSAAADEGISVIGERRPVSRQQLLQTQISHASLLLQATFSAAYFTVSRPSVQFILFLIFTDNWHATHDAADRSLPSASVARCTSEGLTTAISISQYRTGKTLGSGTYAIVKEAVHIKTGKYYACKVINKKLMEGREHMVSVRRASSGWSSRCDRCGTRSTS
jgi:hypothetical protein